ncbi:MAG: transcriptional regulator NrdR [Oscillospiraceae bacterium]|jgi:transcriptional repressor NrdR|nr:transcriptional regulator NrdR [Oscillospiraceae bacterium]
MKCPYCAHPDSRVVDSRPAEEGATIRRRRECINCGRRFTTYENVERLPLIVVKRGGSRQAFDKEKLIRGMLQSCANRPVSLAELTAIADEIEMELQNMLENEIPSTDVGELVMRKLKEIDEVAYVRFASVYRQFKDVNSFMEEIQKIINGK